MTPTPSPADARTEAWPPNEELQQAVARIVLAIQRTEPKAHWDFIALLSAWRDQVQSPPAARADAEAWLDDGLATRKDYEECLAEKGRLTAELGRLIDGDVGAARAPALIDLIVHMQMIRGDAGMQPHEGIAARLRTLGRGEAGLRGQDALAQAALAYCEERLTRLPWPTVTSEYPAWAAFCETRAALAAEAQRDG